MAPVAAAGPWPGRQLAARDAPLVLGNRGSVVVPSVVRSIQRAGGCGETSRQEARMQYDRCGYRSKQMPSPQQPHPMADLSALQHEESALQYRGIISRVLEDGYAYIEEHPTNAGESKSKRYFISFSRSIPNYRGETPQELRVSPGTQVRFSRQGDNIEYIEVIKQE